MEQNLNSLIAIPSQSGSEHQISIFIANWLKTLGIEVFQESENVTAVIKGKNSNKCLIFDGHLDTVGAGDLEQWKTNPFTPSKSGGNIFGLGASDMKSGLAVLMELARYYSKKTPECDLFFAFVVGEEVDGRGSKHFINWFQDKYAGVYQTTEALITEPTSASRVEVGHRGNYFVKIAVNSRSGHASLPQNKDSAILLANKIIAGLITLNITWSKKYKNPYMDSPSIAITAIKAGDFSVPNKIAAESLIQLDVRTTPEMHYAVPGLLDDFLSKHTEKAHILHCDGSPSGFTDDTSRLRQVYSDLYPKIPQGTMLGSSDLCFFVNSGIPAIIFGPGQKDTIHDANEYVPVKNLTACFNIFKEVVVRYGKK